MDAKQAETDQATPEKYPVLLEDTIERDPRKLYKWIVFTNLLSGKFFPLTEDKQNDTEVKALCIMLSRRETTVPNFLACVADLDLFFKEDLGPAFANLEIPTPRHLPDTLKRIKSEPNWRAVFNKPKKVKEQRENPAESERDRSPQRTNKDVDE